MKKLYFIDPQSYHNVSIYDTCLLAEVRGFTTTYFHNVKIQCEKLQGIEYRPVFSYSDKRGIVKALSYIASLLQIAFHVMRYKPDLVHIQWFRLFVVDHLFVSFLQHRGIKVVHTAHNLLPHNQKKKDKQHYAWYYSHVNAIIVHTAFTKEQLQQQFGVEAEKISVIPHGMLHSMVKKEDAEKRAEELEAELHTKDKIVFASLGHQTYYKSVDVIANVWDRCEALNANPHCMLLIVGRVENVDLKSLEKYNNVKIVNKLVSDLDFDAYLSLSSIVLLTYRRISQSGVLFTALQRGVPVMVSDVGGLADPLQVANVGLNIGQPNADNIEQGMLQVITGKMHCNKKDFDKVRAAFSWQQTGQLTSSLYDSLTPLGSGNDAAE